MWPPLQPLENQAKLRFGRKRSRCQHTSLTARATPSQRLTKVSPGRRSWPSGVCRSTCVNRRAQPHKRTLLNPLSVTLFMSNIGRCAAVSVPEGNRNLTSHDMSNPQECNNRWGVKNQVAAILVARGGASVLAAVTEMCQRSLCRHTFLLRGPHGPYFHSV